jgi:hypothetical protein
MGFGYSFLDGVDEELGYGGITKSFSCLYVQLRSFEEKVNALV